MTVQGPVKKLQPGGMSHRRTMVTVNGAVRGMHGHCAGHCAGLQTRRQHESTRVSVWDGWSMGGARMAVVALNGGRVHVVSSSLGAWIVGSLSGPVVQRGPGD